MKKREVSEKIRQALLEQPVKLAYLYGSFVTGKKRRGRDVDVAVVLEKKNKQNEAELGLILQKALGQNQPEIDLRIIDQDSSPVFLRNILKD
ncbi:MAG: nucleotidyltransferase domain-containing protein, partial [Candidatus Beckwithbacteria bacterium]